MYIRHHKGAAETNGSIIETSHFVFVWRFGCVDRWLECYRNVVSIFLYVHLASKGLKHGTTKTNFSPSGIGSVVKPRSIGSTHAGDHAQRMDCADGFVQCVVGGNHISMCSTLTKSLTVCLCPVYSKEMRPSQVSG